MRLRSTAFPVFFVTVKPKRGPVAAAAEGSAWRTNPGRVTFRPRATARNSLRRLSRPGRAGAGFVAFRRSASCGRAHGGR